MVLSKSYKSFSYKFKIFKDNIIPYSICCSKLFIELCKILTIRNVKKDRNNIENKKFDFICKIYNDFKNKFKSKMSFNDLFGFRKSSFLLDKLIMTNNIKFIQYMLGKLSKNYFDERRNYRDFWTIYHYAALLNDETFNQFILNTFALKNNSMKLLDEQKCNPYHIAVIANNISFIKEVFHNSHVKCIESSYNTDNISPFDLIIINDRINILKFLFSKHNFISKSSEENVKKNVKKYILLAIHSLVF